MTFLQKIKQNKSFAKINKTKIFIYFLFVVLGAILSIITYTTVTYYSTQDILLESTMATNKAAAQEKAQKEKEEIRTMILDQYFGELDLVANNVLVKELNSTKELYAKNINQKVGLASLTKIATASVALADSAETTIIKAPFLYAADDNGLIANEIFETKKLIEFMFIVSSNDAATAISYAGELKEENHQLFLKQMNALADKLDMKSTIFFSNSGLDINKNINGSYGSALDVSKLVKFFHDTYPNFTQNVTVDSKEICSETICHTVKNTNPLIFDYPNIIFSKTGWTRKAGGNLALIYKIDDIAYSIVILGSTKKDRFEDAKKIFAALHSYSQQNKKNQ